MKQKQAMLQVQQHVQQLLRMTAVPGGSQPLSSMQQQLLYKDASGSSCILGGETATEICSLALVGKPGQQAVQ